jgi:hypothetical protein
VFFRADRSSDPLGTFPIVVQQINTKQYFNQIQENILAMIHKNGKLCTMTKSKAHETNKKAELLDRTPAFCLYSRSAPT